MKSCALCGIGFNRVPGKSAQKYCSDQCRAAAKKERASAQQALRYKRNRAARLSSVLECACCGNSYVRADGFPKYCSVACRKRSGSSAGNHRRRAAMSAVSAEPFAFMEIYDRDGGRCSLCGAGTPLDLRGSHDDLAPELDHIIPLSRGGHHAAYNAQIACRKCNIKKGNRIYAVDRIKAAALWPTKPVTVRPPHARPTSRNQSGTRGVFYDKYHDRWIAQVERDGKRARMAFRSQEAAIEAREDMEREHGVKKESCVVASYFAQRARG